MKSPFFFLSISCLFLASGCAHYCVPKPTVNIDDRVRKFYASGSVTLHNNQPSVERQLIMHPGGDSYYANPREWTDVALQLTERELAKRGLHIVSNSGKRVAMAVESVHTEYPDFISVEAHELKTDVVLKVQTSDGYSATYTGTRYDSTAILSHHYNKALAYAVAEMLNDERFIAFLSK